MPIAARPGIALMRGRGRRPTAENAKAAERMTQPPRDPGRPGMTQSTPWLWPTWPLGGSSPFARQPHPRGMLGHEPAQISEPTTRHTGRDGVLVRVVQVQPRHPRRLGFDQQAGSAATAIAPAAVNAMKTAANRLMLCGSTNSRPPDYSQPARFRQAVRGWNNKVQVSGTRVRRVAWSPIFCRRGFWSAVRRPPWRTRMGKQPRARRRGAGRSWGRGVT